MLIYLSCLIQTQVGSPHMRLQSALLLAALCLHSTAAVYKKPKVSSEKCVHAINVIRDRTDAFKNDLACVGCDPANEACAPGCQVLVDKLYVACDGVSLPDGLYYDPAQSLTGLWEAVYPNMKIAVERCGCNGASTLQAPTSALLIAVLVALYAVSSFF
jgi:hypothetical protein